MGCTPLGCLGGYISPESSCLSGSITGTQQLTIIIHKYNLQAPRLLAQCAVEQLMNKVLKQMPYVAIGVEVSYSI